jgi:GNAT superfamily N-acetyltransferase
VTAGPKERVGEAPEALVRIADANYAEAFRQIARLANPEAPRISLFGGAEAIVTGAPGSFFNPVVVMDDRVTEDDVRQALSWSRTFHVKPSVHVREGLENRVIGPAGELDMMVDEWPSPVMTLRISAATEPPIPPELSIRILRPDEIDHWYEATGAIVRSLIPSSLALGDNVWFAAGFVDERPVAHALSLAAEGAVGIYAVGTIETARRRGYGAAVTWAAIDAGRRGTGLDLAILQSSEMGAGVYRGMGFRDLGRYILFRPRPAPAA